MQRANDRLTPATRAVLTPGGSLWGSPSTILVLGSDARPGETSSRSDSILLLRIDPSRQQIAELSIPRDLRTEIPGLRRRQDQRRLRLRRPAARDPHGREPRPGSR